MPGKYRVYGVDLDGLKVVKPKGEHDDDIWQRYGRRAGGSARVGSDAVRGGALVHRGHYKEFSDTYVR